MTDWKPQHYRQAAKELAIPASILDSAIATGKATVAVHPSLPPILTLRHLAYLTGNSYLKLRQIVSREGVGENPYRLYRIRKRPLNGLARFRVICVPEFELGEVQSWLSKNLLSLGRPHSASTAFAPASTLYGAVLPHCECRWLIKVDVHRFFESISEISVFNAFRRLGYQPLVALELARLCTRVPEHPVGKRWMRRAAISAHKISSYSVSRLGHLPQGAPTSPMLANLVMYDFDEKLTAIAHAAGMTYTRYADDLTFSTYSMEFTRVEGKKVVSEVYKTLGQFGFRPNMTKTQIVPPRARKVVLGLLVDQRSPRLPREFKEKMRMHLHFLERKDFGAIAHAERRGFSAVAGLRNHLLGLAAYASQIEPDYGHQIRQKILSVQWPLF